MYNKNTVNKIINILKYLQMFIEKTGSLQYEDTPSTSCRLLWLVSRHLSKMRNQNPFEFFVSKTLTCPSLNLGGGMPF
jgi:hypothetical protein